MKKLLFINNLIFVVLFVFLIVLILIIKIENNKFYLYQFLNKNIVTDIIAINQNLTIKEICENNSKESRFNSICLLKSNPNYKFSDDDYVVINDFEISLTKKNLKSELKNDEIIKIKDRILKIDESDEIKSVYKKYFLLYI